MNDTSRELRYRLGTLCERYNNMIADKDTLDFRLGSPEPYGITTASVTAERVYEVESHEISDAIRKLIVEMVDVGKRIREIERF